MHAYSINNFMEHLLDSYRTSEKISKNPHKDMKAKGRSQREKKSSMLREKSREGKIR